MDELAVSWGRAVKVWWSFAWRGFVLAIVLVVPLQVLLYLVIIPLVIKPLAAHPLNPAEVHQFRMIIVASWPILIALAFAVQVQSMRWMLRKAKWSDFRLALVRRDPSTERP